MVREHQYDFYRIIGIWQLELKENIAAINWKLTPEIRQEIDEIFVEENVSTHVNTDQAI